jgi:hypothetical protein
MDWLLVLAACLVAANIAAYAALPGYLKRHHPETWAALGQPTPWNIPVVKSFIWSRAPHRLGDHQLDIYMMVSRILVLALLGWVLLSSVGYLDI